MAELDRSSKKGREARKGEVKVWSWGAGSNGQLGLGTLEDRYAPVEVHALRGMPLDHIACGGSHALATREDGAVLSWGWGHGGALGHGDEMSSAVPRPIMALRCVRIRQAAAGWNHSIFVSDIGGVYASGEGAFGQLGLGDFCNRCSPCHVAALEGVHVSAVACGMRHTLALAKEDDGRTAVFSWGAGKRGQLAVEVSTLVATKGQISRISAPQRVSLLDGVCVAAVVAGGDHSAAITESGQLFLWGRGFAGGADILSPTVASKSLKCRQVALGWSHGLLLTGGGKVMTWGSNRYGQLGRNPNEVKFQNVSMESDHGTALQEVAETTAVDQIVTSSLVDEVRTEAGAWPEVDLRLLSVEALLGSCVASVAAGAEHSIAVLEGGEVLSWGWGEHGQLGTGDSEDRGTPQQVPVPLPSPADMAAAQKGIKVACGSGFCVLWGRE